MVFPEIAMRFLAVEAARLIPRQLALLGQISGTYRYIVYDFSVEYSCVGMR
ncbi:hypothetical protein N602_25460 [Mycobacterium avium subsp. hominissuis 10-5606]|nr:hypothetical protein N602_25460 [Mycobacterium avium subsp. hominissuis 10-5606]